MDKSANPWLLQAGSNEFFILVHGYYSNWTLFADGEEAKKVKSARNDTWWLIDHRPNDLEMVGHQSAEVVGHRLPEGTVHPELKPYLADEDFKKKFPRDDDWRFIDPRGALYEDVTEQRPAPVEKIEANFIVLEGAPDDSDEYQWTAKLPYELQHHEEYLHLFPGHLRGFREALKDYLKNLPDLDIDYYTHGTEHSLFVKKRGGRSHILHERHYGVNDQVAGENKAEAIDAWRARLVSIEQDIRSRIRVCPTCDGTGKHPDVLAEEEADRNKPRRGRGRRR